MIALTVAVAVAGRLAAPDAIGWGDIKLAPSLTAWLAGSGRVTLYTGLLAWSALIAATAGLALFRRLRPGAVVPYGPAMVLGTVIPIAVIG